jgi:chloramphenicol-sensitive protein RarD
VNKGLIYGAAAYGIWGLLPVYWKALQAVPAYEILAHRMAWSLLFLLLLTLIGRRWEWIRELLARPAAGLTFVCTGGVLALNWFVYIWAVNSARILETSLGYFINPLLYVVLGVIFLAERLRRAQWVAVAIAGVGVGYLTVRYGAFPWVALTLAFTFGVYGLLRKTASMGALEGLTLETSLMFLPAAGFLLYLERAGTGAFGHDGLGTSLLLALGGAATALPLLLFAAAARRIRLVTVGLLQYIAPTLQLLLGVWAYGEPFGRTRLVGFTLIWIALAVYSAEGMLHRRKAIEGLRIAD